MRTRRLLPLIAVCVYVATPAEGTGQIRLRDFVITEGASLEGYLGNFSAITVPQIDSTERAVAGVGEFRVRGILGLMARENQSVDVAFDGGIRQFATGGFQLRNYAPREHSGSLETTYQRRIRRVGSLTANAGARLRSISDRPPMPLYLAPGYDRYTAGMSYLHRGIFDLGVVGEVADYAAPKVLPALDLLDRSSVVVTAGVRKIYRSPAELDRDDYWGLRAFSSYSYHSYPQQGQGSPRIDHAVGAGATFEGRWERLSLEFTLEGTRSRSTSRRVEYNAARLNGQADWILGQSTQVGLRGTLARKRFIQPGQDALVPGEEADNASILYAELTRHLGDRVSGAFRFGWQKVETNISGAYYTRFGGSFFLRVRPWN